MSYGVVPANTSILDGSAYKHVEQDDAETQELLAKAPRRISLTPFNVSDLIPEPQSHKFESLDSEVVENTVYRANQANNSHLETVFTGAAKWTMCFLMGIITAGAAFAVNFSVENIAGFKFWAVLTMMERGWIGGSFLVYASINMVLVMASVMLTVYYSPAAAGSGIAEVKAYLNGIDIPGIFLFKTLVGKIVGSIGAVAGGLAIGKEGPFVHAGAAVGALLCQGGTSEYHFTWFKRFWNDRDRADLVACGAAAGVAAAFRSPVGGVLFALEEMTSWWRNQLLWLVFFTTAVVSVTVRVLMKLCKDGSCGFFGSGGFIIFEITEGQENYEFYELLPMLLLGVVGGLLGSSFNSLNAKLTKWRKKNLARYGPRGRLLEGFIISLLTSVITFALPLMFRCQACPVEAGDACPRVDNSHSGNFVNFACAHGHEYNDLATIFFNTQDDAIRNLFSSKTKREYTVGTLITFVTFFYALAVLTYGMALPTGAFVPSILCGAAYGRLVGIFVADMHPHHYIDEGTYALLGAASFLGGCMRMTVCTCVMLLELTNNLALLPLVMLVLLVAKAVGDGTGVKPTYEAQIDVKDFPYLEQHPERFLRHITAREACGKPPATFQRVERVANVVATLRRCPHNGFPVIGASGEGESTILGIMLRSHLMVLLRTKKCFQSSPVPSEVSSRVAFTYAPEHFARPISEDAERIEDVHLSDNDMCQYMDLGPYLNPSYYVVQEDTSLSKVYTLFRTLGLRHLCVIPKANNVVGMITRKDLLPEVLEQKFASSPYAMMGEASPFISSNGKLDRMTPDTDEEDGAAGGSRRRSAPSRLAGNGAPAGPSPVKLV